MASPFFVKNIIKGKIAEIIVFEMFQEINRFIVIPFGTEMLIPDLLKLEKTEVVQNAIGRLRQRPDLSIVDTQTGSHFLIEVKYRESPTQALMLTLAKDLHESWPSAYLCVVSPLGFFFDSCAEIIAREGDISLIDGAIIPQDIQEKYLKIVQDTIKNKDPEQNDIVVS